MSITYGPDLQNQIALMLTRGMYGDLTTAQKTAIDNGNASTPGGAAGRVLNMMGEYSNMFTSTDSTATNIPTEWEGWFVSETAMQAAPVFPTADAVTLRKNNAVARRDAILSYTGIAFDSTADGNIGVFDIPSIRAYVITHALRASPSLFLQPSIVDDAIEEAVAEVWNEADWKFKTKLVTLTIGTDGSVSADGGVVVDKIIGDRIDYDSTFGGFAISVDYPTILDYQSSSVSAGKPSYFHLLRSGDALSWIFERTPDQEYTAKAMVTQATPTMSSHATMNTALASFPTDFRAVIKNRILAVCMLRTGRMRDGSLMYEETSGKIHGLLSRYDNTGGDPEWSEYDNVRPFGLGYNDGFIGGGGI